MRQGAPDSIYAALPYVVQIERNIPDYTVSLKEGADVVSADGEKVGDVSLWRSGFMQVEGPELFGEKRLITPYRIADVSDGEVHLAVSLDELVRR